MFESADPLVSPEWLAQHLDAPDLRVLDATWFLPTDGRDARALYGERRIPGAGFFDIDEIADTSSPLPHMMPAPAKFAARVRKMGVGDGARVVIYDALGLFSAARAWWMFRAMGHEDVAVLDGGFPFWEKAGLPIETGPPSVRMERHFTPRLHTDLIKTYDDIRAAMETQSCAILDARPEARFRGDVDEPRPGVRRGHIPGSVNVPYTRLFDESGRILPTEGLKAVLPSFDARQPIATTCGSGVTAAVLALALARIGRWDVSIYDGSWAEWGAKADAPIAVGDD